MLISKIEEVMSACVLRTPMKSLNHSSPRPRPVPIRSSNFNFSSKEALYLLESCPNFDHLKLVQAKIVRRGLSQDQLLARKLITLSFSFGKIDHATFVFNQIVQPHTYTWNIMIRAYTHAGRSTQALLLFNLMICRGFHPDKFTFPFVVKACQAFSNIEKGREVHGLALKTGFYNDMFVHNTLMDLYFKCEESHSGCKVFETMRVRTVISWTTYIAGLISCGDLDTARGAFDDMPMRNVVSWTAIIHGYVKNQRPEEAFELFSKMRMDNVRPNQFTLVSLLKACTQLGSLELGRWIHDYTLKSGFKFGPFLGTALIDMYSKCGSLNDARQVFKMMDVKNSATWNTMITGLGVHGHVEDALSLFAQMEKANVEPDAITFVGVLCACARKNNLKEGERLFKCMMERHGIEPIMEHCTSMIELYSNANMLDEVTQLVSRMSKKLKNSKSAVLDGVNIIHKVAGETNHSKLHKTEMQILESSSSHVL